MPGTRGPATSLWPRGRAGGALLFGRSRFEWIGTLCQAAIAVAVGGACLAAALDGLAFAWGGVAFALVFLAVLTRAALSVYEARLENGTLTRTWKPFLGAASSETIEGPAVREIVFVKNDVSSVTMVMNDDRRLELDRGTAEEPLRELAEATSRALGVKLTC
ncbi:MAG TPA: hypothetical protein VF950_12795 [Planctomycetota bacterium]